SCGGEYGVGDVVAAKPLEHAEGRERARAPGAQHDPWRALLLLVRDEEHVAESDELPEHVSRLRRRLDDALPSPEVQDVKVLVETARLQDTSVVEDDAGARLIAHLIQHRAV